MSERFPNDVDPIETRDWLQAIESVIREEGVERAQYLIDQLLAEARRVVCRPRVHHRTRELPGRACRRGGRRRSQGLLCPYRQSTGAGRLGH